LTTPQKEKQDHIELLSNKKDHGELTPSPEFMPNEKKGKGSTDSRPNHQPLVNVQTQALTRALHLDGMVVFFDKAC